MLISSKIYNGINGEIAIPGDKSISHRSIIIPSISNGVSEISNILKSEDVLNTMSAFKQMGVKIEEVKDKIIIYGKGLNSLNKPSKEIYLGNSGTSARLLIGLLSSQNFISNLTGDISLSSRPMGRIMDPLNLMGARIDSVDKKLPIRIYGQKLIPINYTVPVPSAQVKSGLILAALNTEGVSKFIEKDIIVETFNSALLWEPWEILKSDNTPYKVFTPYYRKGCLMSEAPRKPLSAPNLNTLFEDKENILQLDDLNLLPRIKWYKEMEKLWEPGEKGAHKKLESFLSDGLLGYKEGRNFPSKKNVSQLSAHMHFGEISPNQVWHRAKLKKDLSSTVSIKISNNDCFKFIGVN